MCVLLRVLVAPCHLHPNSSSRLTLQLQTQRKLNPIPNLRTNTPRMPKTLTVPNVISLITRSESPSFLYCRVSVLGEDATPALTWTPQTPLLAPLAFATETTPEEPLRLHDSVEGDGGKSWSAMASVVMAASAPTSCNDRKLRPFPWEVDGVWEISRCGNDLWVDCDVTGIGNKVEVVVFGGG